MHNRESSCAPVTELWERELSQQERAVKAAAMVNVFWLASEEFGTLKYVSLNNLVMMQGCIDLQNLSVAKNAQYTHHRIPEEMQECISMCIDEDLVEKIKLAPSYNLLTNESTDISSEKHLIIYVSFFGSEGRSETYFLANLILNDGCSAIGIAKCPEEYLDQKGLSLLNCFGLATDRAKVMTGEVGGLAGILP